MSNAVKARWQMSDTTINHTQPTRFDFRLIAIPLALGGLLTLIYYPTFEWFWLRWFREESYYSHGPLIPFISLFLVWRERKRLERVPVHTDRMGLWILVAGLVMHLFSAWTRVHFTSGFSLLVVIMGLVWYLAGRQVVRALWFPLCFLAFMVPMPMDLIAVLTFKLKIFVAQLGSWLLNLFGLPNIREGSVVYMSNTTVTVDAACSGLRSLISFLALGTLYAYLARGEKEGGDRKTTPVERRTLNVGRWTLDAAPLLFWRHALLVALCVPLAILANLVRVLLTLVIANRYGDAILTNDLLHEGFGLMVFAIGLTGFFLAAKMLHLRLMIQGSGVGDQGLGETGDGPSDPRPLTPGTRHPTSFIVAALLLLFVGVITFGAYSEIYDTERYTDRFPEVIGTWRFTQDWYARMDPKALKQTLSILETEDTIYRQYEDPFGHRVDLVIVYSPHNRKVAHPPDICFQGGGWQQQIRDTIPSPYGERWGLTEVNRLILDRDGAKQIALYWYKSGDRQISSYLDQQVRYVMNSVLRRNRASALIRLTTYADSGEDIPAKTRQLEAFAKDVMPLVATVIP